MSESELWQELIAGNKRFVAGNPTHPHQSASRREEMAQGQNPRVAVLACADSRVSPEIIFDQGLGDLFLSGWRAIVPTTPFWEVSNMRSSIWERS